MLPKQPLEDGRKMSQRYHEPSNLGEREKLGEGLGWVQISEPEGNFGSCLGGKSQFNCFQLSIELAMTVVIFQHAVLLLWGECMHLLDNYSFPAEVIHHHEIQPIGKEWGVAVWNRRTLVFQAVRAKRVRFTAWPGTRCSIWMLRSIKSHNASFLNEWAPVSTALQVVSWLVPTSNKTDLLNFGVSLTPT